MKPIPADGWWKKVEGETEGPTLVLHEADHDPQTGEPLWRAEVWCRSDVDDLRLDYTERETSDPSEPPAIAGEVISLPHLIARLIELQRLAEAHFGRPWIATYPGA